MENPFYQRKEDAAARTQERRENDRRRNRPNRPNRPNNPGGGGGNQPNRPNDPGGQKQRNWWGNYNPGPYDPDNPYYSPPGQHGANRPGKLGRKMGEENREAMWGNLLGRSGISYRAGSADPYQDYLRDQFANAEQGFEQARIDRPGLTWWKYLQRTPAYHQGSGTAPPPPVAEPPPTGGGGRPGGDGGRPGGGRR